MRESKGRQPNKPRGIIQIVVGMLIEKKEIVRLVDACQTYRADGVTGGKVDAGFCATRCGNRAFQRVEDAVLRALGCRQLLRERNAAVKRPSNGVSYVGHRGQGKISTAAKVDVGSPVYA